MTNSEASMCMRLLLRGRDFSTILGAKGETLKRLNEDTPATVTVTDGPNPERILTLTGTVEGIAVASKIVVGQLAETSSGSRRSSVNVRFLVPESQCELLICKEIRDLTGASVQVSSELLPKSNEKTVMASGSPDAITRCISHLCSVLIKSPPKEPTMAYEPKPQTSIGPVIISKGRAYIIQGNYAVPMAPDVQQLRHSPLAGLLGLGTVAGPNPVITPTEVSGLAALAGSQLRVPTNTGPGSQTHEMTVPNELIGCIIGKGGTKIAEIRQITGAVITISKFSEGSECASKQDRTITITGTIEQIALAKYLINTSMHLHKAQLGSAKTGSITGLVNPNTIPTTQLLQNPQILSALSKLTGMEGITSAGVAPDLAQGTSAAAVLAQRHTAYLAKTCVPLPVPANGPPKEKKASRFAPA